MIVGERDIGLKLWSGKEIILMGMFPGLLRKVNAGRGGDGEKVQRWGEHLSKLLL